MTKAPRPKLSVESLERLGAPRLASLLMDIAETDKTVARSLKLALAGTRGAGRLASELEKRLRAIARSRTFLDWDKVRPLANELDSLRKTVAGPLAETDVHTAISQMRALLAVAGSVFDRSDDSNGTLSRVFDQAAVDLGHLWGLLPDLDRSGLAQELFSLLEADTESTLRPLMASSSPALGAEGRAVLRRLLEKRLSGIPKRDKTPGSLVDYRRSVLTERLMELADLDGDVAAFIAAAESSDQTGFYAAEVAKRLVDSGRHAEALAWLDREPARAEYEHVRDMRTDLRLAALEALGRKTDAQELRWAVFCTSLHAGHLRAYLRALPDFEDAEAEDRAIAHALAFDKRVSALDFLVAWPNLRAANDLVWAHHATLDGRDYKRLRPAAEALAAKFPGAATLLHRLLAEDVLHRSASVHYQYAARDVRSCEALAAHLPADMESHAAFIARLRKEHPRKAAFWNLLG